MTKYLILKDRYCISNYCLVALRKEDIQLIRKWRNEQLDILRQQKILTKNQQISYYDVIVRKTFKQKKPRSILFSFLLNDVCIGYGGLVHIDWNSKRAELSFIADTERYKTKKIYQKDLKMFIKLILKVGFHELHLNRIYTETYDVRPFHVLMLEKYGFNFEGRLVSHVKIRNSYVDSLIHGITKP